VTRPGAVPTTLRSALASPGGSCYRHCDRPIRTRSVRSRLPGRVEVRACPSGVVSVISYTEWTRRNPTPAFRELLRKWSTPPSLVRDWDLRLATRHGPELGRAAERFLSNQRPIKPIRVVYWRLYPFRARDGTERRLFVCFRRGHPHPAFFTASPANSPVRCPLCARRRRVSR